MSSDVQDAMALEAVRGKWEGIYDVGYVSDVEGYPDGAYLARMILGGPLLTAATPAALESAIRASYARWTAE